MFLTYDENTSASLARRRSSPGNLFPFEYTHRENSLAAASNFPALRYFKSVESFTAATPTLYANDNNALNCPSLTGTFTLCKSCSRTRSKSTVKS